MPPGGVVYTGGKFAVGVVDTGGTAGVVDTGGKFATSVVDTAVMHLELQISPRIFEKI